MRIGKTKVMALLLAAIMLCTLLSACKKEEDEEGVVDDPTQSSQEGDNGLNPPENLGSPDDVDFNLQGPGDTNFDDVGLSNSQPGVSAVGDAEGEGELDYTVTTPETDGDEDLPDLSTDPGQGDEQNLGQVSPPLTTNSEEEQHPAEQIPAEQPPTENTSTQQPPAESVPSNTDMETDVTDSVPDAVKLPNTGIFLEDDD